MGEYSRCKGCKRKIYVPSNVESPMYDYCINCIRKELGAQNLQKTIKKVKPTIKVKPKRKHRTEIEEMMEGIPSRRLLSLMSYSELERLKREASGDAEDAVVDEIDDEEARRGLK